MHIKKIKKCGDPGSQGRDGQGREKSKKNHCRRWRSEGGSERRGNRAPGEGECLRGAGEMSGACSSRPQSAAARTAHQGRSTGVWRERQKERKTSRISLMAVLRELGWDAHKASRYDEGRKIMEKLGSEKRERAFS